MNQTQNEYHNESHNEYHNESHNEYHNESHNELFYKYLLFDKYTSSGDGSDQNNIKNTMIYNIKNFTNNILENRLYNNVMDANNLNNLYDLYERLSDLLSLEPNASNDFTDEIFLSG